MLHAVFVRQKAVLDIDSKILQAVPVLRLLKLHLFFPLLLFLSFSGDIQCYPLQSYEDIKHNFEKPLQHLCILGVPHSLISPLYKALHFQ